MPEQEIYGRPQLGRLLAIRPENGAYSIDAKRPLHIYVVGETPDPALFTIHPNRRGHRREIKIYLDQIAE
jgi:hypothetical protein